MVNYRRVLCEVALVSAFVILASSAPIPDSIHYDQRQNGTENYRVNIDGVVFAVVPAEPLFAALGDMDDLMDLLSAEDLSSLASLGSLGSIGSKPPTSTTPSVSGLESEGEKPSAAKPQEKPTEEKPSEQKPSEEKPSEEKPVEAKPVEAKPLETKPEVPVKPAELPPLSDVSLSDDLKAQKKDVTSKKQEKTKRLKNRLAAFLMPLLRKTRHQ